MKRLGIDARLYRQTGVGVYTRNLLSQMEKMLPKEVEVFVYLMKRDFDTVTFENKNFIKREADFIWHGVGEQTGFLKTINRDSLDLMHFTYFSYPVFYRKPFISTIHDLTPYLFKTGRASTKGLLFYKVKHLFFTHILKAQIRDAKAIITPTYAVKDQIVQHFGQRFESKIYPIYEGVSKELLETEENKKLKKVFQEDFIVYIGNFYPHKNVERLIAAFAKVQSKAKLVLTGPDDFFTQRVAEQVKKHGQEGRIIFYKNPTLPDLVFFYKNAKALINPSLSEGFGLPTIEALYFKCPVIASDIPVFNETLGASYTKFDPEDVSSITSVISSFLTTKPYLPTLDILKKFSFKNMAIETVALYKKHLNI